MPFNKVGIDTAKYAGKNFLILIDFFWLEVEQLKNKILIVHINILKKIFSIHGIFEIIVVCNIPFAF